MSTPSNRLLRISVVVASAITIASLSLSPAPSASANSGTKCEKVGQVNKEFSTTCTSTNNKLIWIKSKNEQGANTSVATTGPGAIRPTLTSLAVDLALVNYDMSLDDKMMNLGPVVSVGDSRPELTIQFLPHDAQVRAVSRGVVLEIRQQPESCDAEIIVVNRGAGKNAMWTVEYDHVRNIRVRFGTLVEPGQIIGTVGPMFGCNGKDSDPGFVELMVSRSDKDVAVCPLLLMKKDVAAKIRSDLLNVMSRWNEMHPGTYSETKLKGSGCLVNETTK